MMEPAMVREVGSAGRSVGELEAAIDACFDDVARTVGTFQGFDRVWESMRQASTGGKLLRPRLLLSAQRAFGGAPDEHALQAAVAIELLHVAFLLHDDVLDRDLVRRGGPNLISRQRDAALVRGVNPREARRYGESCAVLVGDLLLAAAHRLIGELDEPVGRRRALLGVLDDAVSAAAVGEHADLRISLSGEADEDTILRTMALKTARYSFSAPLRFGALMGGASSEVVGTLGFIGDMVGIAFQMRDDVLGVFGDPGRTGKSVLSDLREGKITLLVAYARMDPSWQRVAHLFGDPDLDERGAALLRSAIERSGARARAEAVAAQLIDEASMSMYRAVLPPELIEDLERVIASAMGRSR